MTNKIINDDTQTVSPNEQTDNPTPDNPTTASINKDEEDLQKQGPTANPLGKATEENSDANVPKAKKQGFLGSIVGNTSIGVIAAAAVLTSIAVIFVSVTFPVWLLTAGLASAGGIGGYLGYKAVKDKFFPNTKNKKLSMLGAAGGIILGTTSPVVGMIAGTAGVVSKFVGKRSNSSKANNVPINHNNSPKIQSDSPTKKLDKGVFATGPLPTQTLGNNPQSSPRTPGSGAEPQGRTNSHTVG